MSKHGSLVLLLALAPLLMGFDPFRAQNGDVAQGNALLEQKKYKEALEHYDRAAKQLPEDPGVQYNRGIALLRLGKLKQAQEAWVKGSLAEKPELRARSLYNMGNALFEQKMYKEAAEAYKKALRLRPDHRHSKWNLELALRRIEEKKKEEEKKKKEEEKKKKEEEKKQDQQKQDKKDEQKKDDKQDQKDQQKQDQKQDQKGDKKREQPKPSPDKQQPKPDPQKRQMDAVLDALDRSDKNLQKQRARMMHGGRPHRPLKDW